MEFVQSVMRRQRVCRGNPVPDIERMTFLLIDRLLKILVTQEDPLGPNPLIQAVSIFFPQGSFEILYSNFSLHLWKMPYTL